ncbi:MAG: hypothetical protein KKA07_02435 [Bacteroidetes bacterium]|nr:hypothetical protein [Bacteroidota bacterium]MBU1717907.1 hypothetical protein [Bacteroidota bacterium]
MKKILLVGLLLVAFLRIEAQNYSDDPETGTKNKETSGNRFYTGGGIALQIGSVTILGISPTLGYKITESFSVGLGVKYLYYSEVYSTGRSSASIYGASPFARYLITESVFAYTEYEFINIVYKDPGYALNDQMSLESFFVGGGYRQEVTNNSWFYLLVLFNLNNTPNTIYQNPVLRMGIEIGL